MNHTSEKFPTKPLINRVLTWQLETVVKDKKGRDWAYVGSDGVARRLLQKNSKRRQRLESREREKPLPVHKARRKHSPARGKSNGFPRQWIRDASF